VCAFGRNFEESLRVALGDAYEQLEEEGRTTFGLAGDQSKPLLARFAAERVALDEGSEGYSSLVGLADAITSLE
jgi:hypothetical protein